MGAQIRTLRAGIGVLPVKALAIQMWTLSAGGAGGMINAGDE
jgi:hypothetical protein